MIADPLTACGMDCRANLPLTDTAGSDEHQECPEPEETPCANTHGSLQCELLSGHLGKHGCAIGWDAEGRVDDGVSWSDAPFADVATTVLF